MFDKLIKYLDKNNFEVKPKNGGGIIIFALWKDGGKLEKYLKKIKSEYELRYSADYDYKIFSIN